MTIHVDTSALVDALTGPRRSLEKLIELTGEGHRLACSSLVLFEWLRGPRTAEDLEVQEAILPAGEAVPFGHAEADAAAKLYRLVRRPRGREIDLALAASAITAGAAFWTLNREDFEDIPGLRLV